MKCSQHTHKRFPSLFLFFFIERDEEETITYPINNINDGEHGLVQGKKDTNSERVYGLKLTSCN